jgi:hypothetical protein
MKTITKNTEEVAITVEYKYEDTGACSINIKGTGDFRHHLIEEILFLIAKEFDMGSHLETAINYLKVRLDNSKEVYGKKTDKNKIRSLLF